MGSTPPCLWQDPCQARPSRRADLVTRLRRPHRHQGGRGKARQHTRLLHLHRTCCRLLSGLPRHPLPTRQVDTCCRELRCHSARGRPCTARWDVLRMERPLRQRDLCQGYSPSHHARPTLHGTQDVDGLWHEHPLRGDGAAPSSA